MPACVVQSDGSAPIADEQRHVVKIEGIEKGGEPVCMAPGVVIVMPIAVGRQTEAHMVGGNATPLRPKPADQVPEREGPGWIPVYEHDRLPLAFINEMHPMSGRGGEKPALERIHVVRHPARTNT